MFKLKDLSEKNIIPNNGRYYNEQWYVYVSSVIKQLLMNYYGKRYLLYDFTYDEIEGKTKNEIIDDLLVPFVKNEIDCTFIKNNDNYIKMFNAIKATYNPLYNVDGTETLEYTKTNTGTQKIENDGTNTDNGSEVLSGGYSDTTTFNGTETNTNTKNGTETKALTYTGTETNTKTLSGSETDTTTFSGTENKENIKSGNVVKSNTTYESDTFTNSEKETYNDLTDSETTTFNNRQDSTAKTFNNRSDTDTKTYANRNDTEQLTFGNRSDTDVKSFDNRNDVTSRQYNNHTNTISHSIVNENENLRTDNLTESYIETRIRQGNIGVTKSTDLIESEMILRERYNFLEIVMKDIVNDICYMSY